MTLHEWIDTYARAWRDKDDAAVVELFTEKAEYRSSPTTSPHRGRAEIAAYWRQATSTQRDLQLRFGQPVVDGNRVAVEWWALMRDPDWRPDAEEVTLPGCLVLRFADDGRCEELREYYNPLFGSKVAPPDGWGR